MQISKSFGEGNDLFVVRTGDDYELNFFGGDDVLVTEAGSTLARMGAGDDFVRVLGGDVRVVGQDGADRFDAYGSGARINGGGGNDLFYIRGGSDHGFAGHTGDDRFIFLADATQVLLLGEDGNDLYSGHFHSIAGKLLGGIGNDRFLDFGNYDGRLVTLFGGPGNDVYRVDAASPASIVELSGEGTDTVKLTGEHTGLVYVLGANIENLSAAAVSSDFATVQLEGNALDNRIEGSSSFDNIFGRAGDDRLNGGASLDFLAGGEGDDRISGGLDLDYIETGPGNDLIVYESVLDANGQGAWGPEWITDWEVTDRIDLSGVDANSEIAGNQAFEFVGYSFGGEEVDTSAGTLTIGGFGGELYIIGHTDSDDIYDFIIGLWSEDGEAALTVDHLIL